MDCSVKQQLLIAMNESLNALEEAVERMTNLAGKNKADEFVAAHRRVMELRPIADASRKDYENHRREHGCWKILATHN
jgi:hypothetical protein